MLFYLFDYYYFILFYLTRDGCGAHIHLHEMCWQSKTAQVWDTMLVFLVCCSKKKKSGGNLFHHRLNEKKKRVLNELLGLPGSSLDVFRNFVSLMSCSCCSSWSSSSKGRSQQHTALCKEGKINVILTYVQTPKQYLEFEARRIQRQTGSTLKWSCFSLCKLYKKL